jgi:polysaccharide export outer membrane protein
MTKSELENYIREEIYPKYIHEVPAVTVRFENFRISVTGDVAKPGSFVVPNERINVLEAIAMAGDLNITGRRDNVLLVRVNADGSRTTARLDLTDKDLILSPYFYLQQNDVLYVEPNISKARSSTVVPPTASLAISIIGSALSVASLIMTILNFTK